MNWALAFGVFFGNWLTIPLLFKKRTYKDSFFIGLIAAILVLISSYFLRY